MASEAQVLANRRNAEKSTGPRTPEGKAAGSQNALKHGLLARRAVIKGEDPGEFEFYRAMVKDFSNDRVLDRLLMYERRIELSLYKTMAELQRLRLAREMNPPAEKPTAAPTSAVCSVPERTSRETPYGATTNTPENRSCETNPICSGPNDSQDPVEKEVMTTSSPNELRKTDPIPGTKEHASSSSLPSIGPRAPPSP